MNILYTMDGCKYCVLAKELFERMDIDYDEVKLGRDISKEEVKKIKRQAITRYLPQVVYNGENLGGLVEAARYFKSKGMV